MQNQSGCIKAPFPTHFQHYSIHYLVPEISTKHQQMAPRDCSVRNPALRPPRL